MTEQTLNRAIEIKRKLDTARHIKSNIEEKRSLCTGNYSEVAARKFELCITDGAVIKSIAISSNSAYEALTKEFTNNTQIVSVIEDELEQLK